MIALQISEAEVVINASGTLESEEHAAKRRQRVRQKMKTTYDSDPEKKRQHEKATYEADPEKQHQRKKAAYQADLLLVRL